MDRGEGKAYIGTSGWEYPHWIGPFYPRDMRQAEHLRYYSGRFRTVEVNNSFYRLPAPDTFRRWRDTVPPDFVFAVKASRYTTHRKYLTEPERSTERFFEAVRHLGSRLGPILFQLPPHWGVNPERLAAFLEAMPGGYRFTLELRNESWFHPEVYDILRRHGAAFCLYEIAGRRSPGLVTADFVYIRLHGPEQSAYTGRYSEARLSSLARKIRAWNRQGLDVYCYFDNDQKGYAAGDARRLYDKLHAPVRGKTPAPGKKSQEV